MKGECVLCMHMIEGEEGSYMHHIRSKLRAFIILCLLLPVELNYSKHLIYDVVGGWAVRLNYNLKGFTRRFCRNSPKYLLVRIQSDAFKRQVYCSPHFTITN